MAKVIIEIEDTGPQQVKIQCHPSYEEIQKLRIRNDVTAAHLYGVRLLAEALKVSKELTDKFGEQDPSKLWIPPGS